MGAEFTTGHTWTALELLSSYIKISKCRLFTTKYYIQLCTIRNELLTLAGLAQSSEKPLQMPLYKHHPQASSVSTHSTQLKHLPSQNIAHVTSKSSYLSAAVQLYIVRAFSLVANGIPTSSQSLNERNIFGE